MKTSLSDVDFYKNACNLFVNDARAFSTFRSNTQYRRVLEHVPEDKGKEYLDIAMKNCPWLIDRLDDIRKNDSVGSPRVYGYKGYGLFSPTTLRYLKVMTDIYKDLGSADMGNHVIEIGGGYGGQARILGEFMEFKKYSIIDLGVVCRLQEKYLFHFKKPDPHWIMPEWIENMKRDKFDFVISNFAFDELLPETQKIYFDHVIKNSKHGYLSGRFSGKNIYKDHMTIDKFKDWCDIRPYTPNPGIECQIITW